MKVLIVALVLVATATASDWVPKEIEENIAIRTECRAENPLSDEQFEKMNDEEPVRRYILCICKKHGLFSEHEGFHADRIGKQLNSKFDEAEAIAIADKCADKNVEKSSADVWAFRGHSCLLNSKLGSV